MVYKMGNEFEEFKLVIGKDKSEIYPVPLPYFFKELVLFWLSIKEL